MAKTPKVISLLLAAIAATCVLSAVLNALFFGSPGLDAIFGLTWKPLFWQPLTYLFVSESEGQGLTSSYVFSLCFNLYVLWVLSSIIIEYLGKWGYLAFFFLCGLLAAFAALAGMALTGHHPLLTGQIPVILGLLTLWTLLNPEAILFVFYLFPIKVKWITLGAFGIVAITSILSLDLVSFCFYAAAPLFAYFFWLFYRNTPLEAFRAFKRHLSKPFTHGINEKIIDIRTGKPRRKFFK